VTRREFDVKAGRVSRVLGASVLTIGLCSQVGFWGYSALAQDFNQPPSDIQGGGDGQSEAGALALRIDRLEAALRRATGQIEDLQNQNRKLADDLKRFREDVEFRLSGKAGAAAPLPSSKTGAAAPLPQQSDIAAAPATEPSRSRRKDDAFDPNADPNAPGAPKQIGTTAPSAPLMLSSHQSSDDAGLKPLPGPTPRSTVAAVPAQDSAPTFVPSGVPFSDSREQYKSALAAYKAGQYADAEALFKAYIEANKGAANVPDAVFYIGETYMQRARPREAAEQYLRVSTEFPRSFRAPESMVRLGLALAKLGNNEQACATFVEVTKRYPSAPGFVKRSADREIQAHRCS
jgi:tol-pal system protein YbgF